MSTVVEELATIAVDAATKSRSPEDGAPEAPKAPGPETPAFPTEEPLTREQILRPAFGALSTTFGAAFLVGGMFVGITPRIYAALGGMIGVAMAVWAARATKRVALIQTLSFVGVLVGGIALISISDLGALGNLSKIISEAAGNARLRRPPAPFDLGWRAILPWTIGMIGYAATWIGSVGRKPAVGILVPIPIIAFAAIAQPAEAQVPAGIVAFVTFVVGLTIIYRADRGEGEGVSTAYELKRAARAAPLVVVLIAVLVALAQTNLLFPAPLYDPTQRAQLPKAVPLSGVKDRELFRASVPSGFTGPWRVGVLDVYDGEAWRLPPYSSSKLKDAPRSGLIDEAFGQPQQPQLRARVTIGDLEGTVLPLPARVHGLIVERAPPLVTDKRTETVRVKEGQIAKKLAYDVQFALLPTEDALRAANAPTNRDILNDYTDLANRRPPEPVMELLREADSKTKNLWDRLDFIRRVFLDTVVSSGQGLPVAVPPEKIADMLDGSKKATPYEIVAGQAILARWAGIPSRIGYGFDRGEAIGTTEVSYRPKHGAAWLEVYFEGFGWFPVTGLPKQAEASLSGEQSIEANILPSDQIAVQLFIPLRVEPKNLLFKQAQILLLMLSPFIVTGLLVWLLWPVYFKGRRRSRRRTWAMEAGRQARIAVAYAELRDMATDLGVGDPYLTPLAYVGRVVPDEEHRELAWLVTRTLWGDLRHEVTDDEVFAAEELSRSLRRRLFEAQPFTIRGISLVSRLSLRNPYAPELLSPALQKFDIKKAVKPLNPLKLAKLPRRRAAKETAHEAVEGA